MAELPLALESPFVSGMLGSLLVAVGLRLIRFGRTAQPPGLPPARVQGALRAPRWTGGVAGGLLIVAAVVELFWPHQKALYRAQFTEGVDGPHGRWEALILLSILAVVGAWFVPSTERLWSRLRNHETQNDAATTILAIFAVLVAALLFSSFLFVD